MFLKENTRWDDTEPLFAKLLTDYSSVSFVVCPADGKKKLKYFFSESTLASSKNLLLADSEFNSSMAIKDFPTYMIIDNQRKVLLLIPPLPKKEFAISALQAFLNRNN
jgi:hypothetical protein